MSVIFKIRKAFVITFMVIICFNSHAQNKRNFHYIIRKSDIESGRLKLIYKDKEDNILPLKMCYPKLHGEQLSMINGIPVFHFKRISSSLYDTVPDCISNNSEAIRVEIDVRKSKIGDSHTTVKIPFRGIGWGVTVLPYRLRFKQGSIPASAESKVEFSGTVGYTFGYAKINHEEIVNCYLIPGVFFGMSSAALRQNTVSQPQKLTRDQNNPAIAYGLSLILGRNNFGFSLSLGFDCSLGKNSSLWIYQNKPWIGLGLSGNLGLF